MEKKKKKWSKSILVLMKKGSFLVERGSLPLPAHGTDFHRSMHDTNIIGLILKDILVSTHMYKQVLVHVHTV